MGGLMNKNNSPMVSVVLCTNRISPYLEDAVNSILSQTFKDLELILVINGVGKSVMQEIMNSIKTNDPRLRIVYTPMNGLSFSLNYGIHLARGVYIARMDDDDISREERIAVQVAYLQTHPDVVVCGTWYDLIDINGVTNGFVTGKISNKSIKKSLYYRNPLCHPSIMMRRDILFCIGGYSLAVHCEDYELWVRLSSIKGVQLSVLPKRLLGYRMDAIGTARSSRNAYVHMCGIQFRMFIDTHNPRWLLGSIFTYMKVVLNTILRGHKGKRN